MRTYYVYIMASKSSTLYVGMTNDIRRRVREHKEHFYRNAFTGRYNINRLVWYETTDSVRSALQREKQLKGWRRDKKFELVASVNPEWRDLSRDWD